MDIDNHNYVYAANTKDIEAAIEKGREYNPDVIGSSYFTSKCMGIGPAWGHKF
jgi:hypothetical protein